MVGRDIDVEHQPRPARRRPATTSASTGCARGAIRSTPCRSASRRGEILGMAGLVGAGRSEVARAIFGVEPPVAGTVSLDGRRCHDREPGGRHPARRSFSSPRIGGPPGLVVDFSIRENVVAAGAGPLRRVRARVGRARSGRPWRRSASSCRSRRRRSRSRRRRSSGGNQQKVVLAKWLALGPRC